MATHKSSKNPKLTNYCFTALDQPIALVYHSDGYWISSGDLSIMPKEAPSKIQQSSLPYTDYEDDQATNNHEAEAKPKFGGRDPLTCEICGQSSADPHTMKEHMQSHGEGQNLTCASCKHLFTKLQYLMDHWRNTVKERKCRATLEVKTQIGEVNIIQKRVNKVTKRSKGAS